MLHSYEMKIALPKIPLHDFFIFYFKKLKWNILSTQHVDPCTRYDQERHKNLYSIYNLEKEKEKQKRKVKGITTTSKILLFFSFHISHTVANQITFKKVCWTWESPPSKLNWVQWSNISKGATIENPTHRVIWDQTAPKKERCKNKWFTFFRELHPETHRQ